MRLIIYNSLSLLCTNPSIKLRREWHVKYMYDCGVSPVKGMLAGKLKLLFEREGEGGGRRVKGKQVSKFSLLYGKVFLR